MPRIPVLEPYLGKEELANVMDAVKSGWVSSRGPYVQRFEKGFARYIGAKNGASTSNGTTALHLAVKALGIGKGDSVIIPALTYVATANAVAYSGANPVLVDVSKDYWCMILKG